MYKRQQWPNEETRQLLVEFLQQRQHQRNVELPLKLGSGEERTVLISTEAIALDGRACTLKTFIDITERKRAEQQVRELATQLSLAEQAERQRIAAILHDDLQQRLFALQVRLTSASAWAAKGETKAATAEMDQMRSALANAIDLTRRLTVDLSPPILHGEGLYHAIIWLSSRMKEQYGLNVGVELETSWRPLDEGMRVALFQIVRELLFNVVKHAGVREATVILAQSDGLVTLRVQDGGAGFDLQSAVAAGQGLRQARQRLELYGGQLALESQPGQGTRIIISVPLKAGSGLDETTQEQPYP